MTTKGTKDMRRLYELLESVPPGFDLRLGTFGDDNITLEFVPQGDQDPVESCCPLLEITRDGQLGEQELSDGGVMRDPITALKLATGLATLEVVDAH